MDFIKKSVKNILTVEFNLTNTYLNKTIKYGICLSNNKETFSGTVFQTEDVSILPPDI